jgi:hypothetical protein
LLPAAICPLSSARCLLPAACCLLPAAICPLQSARCNLPSAICPLPAACCLLPAARCNLPAAICPLQSARSTSLPEDVRESGWSSGKKKLKLPQDSPNLLLQFCDIFSKLLG